jgi:hypothetical protein
MYVAVWYPFIGFGGVADPSYKVLELLSEHSRADDFLYFIFFRTIDHLSRRVYMGRSLRYYVWVLVRMKQFNIEDGMNFSISNIKQVVMGIDLLDYLVWAKSFVVKLDSRTSCFDVFTI